VFGHLLGVEGLANGADLPRPDFLRSTRSMNEIRQFVYDILDAKEEQASKDDKGDLQRWIAAAELPTSPRETPVSEALTELASASQRALLLAVAMLHGAHADVIDGAASALVASLPGAPDAALDRSPLGERLREIGADADPARHVRFTRSGYEAAVRLFFWRHFPELHGVLATWVRVTLASNHLSDDDRTEMAGGFAAQCLDARYQRYWTALLRLLLSRLADRPFETTRTVDARIFLHVADPSRLTARQPTSPPPITQSDVARQLAAGWALAFTRLPGTEWASHASDWLRCAAEDDTNRHPLLNVLIEGGRPATAVLPQLYGLAHRAPFRDVIADLVLNQISAVQGVELP